MPMRDDAIVSRAKLREVKAHHEAFKMAPRARLYREYLKYVEEMRSLAVLMENVPRESGMDQRG